MRNIKIGDLKDNSSATKENRTSKGMQGKNIFSLRPRKKELLVALGPLFTISSILSALPVVSQTRGDCVAKKVGVAPWVCLWGVTAGEQEAEGVGERKGREAQCRREFCHLPSPPIREAG